MAAPVAPPPTPQIKPGPRAAIKARTLRADRWWVSPAISFGVLSAFIIYATYAAFVNGFYYVKPYISPFYSPCVATVCGGDSHQKIMGASGVPHVGIFGPWWAISPAIIILIFPLGFRMSCYYYRRAYYRAFWLSPPACAVAEPHKKYSGETRFPLIMQNIHRYFFYAGLVFNAILTYDAVVAFVTPRSPSMGGGYVGLGSFVLLANAVLLWMYSLSCHSCRHIVGGRLKHFSKHPIRFRFWGVVTKLNARHMQFAWASLIFVALTDMYVRLAAAGWLGHGRWI
ncbi:MAG TPA: hypothetical protein VFN68_05900 [Acidimicrobiales bacterium]|nr:hypothetical protein [Acidimicrobiales bacterium]